MARNPVPRRTIRFRVTELIDAPCSVVRAAYRNYTRWPQIFPTIHAIRTLGRRDGWELMEVDHVEGRVLNAIATPSPNVLVLQESKRLYDATFVNTFTDVDGKTLLVVEADIEPKGPVRLLRPVARVLARRLIERYQLHPLKLAVEGRGNARHGSA